MSDPSASPLTLHAIVPTGGGHCNEFELTADPKEHGMDVKKKIEKLSNIPVEDMEIFVNREGSQKWLRDDDTLEGIEDSAVLTVGVHGTGGHNYHEEELPDTAVENSIAAKGENSYYFAHSRKADVPEEHRIVSGGSPKKLGEGDALPEPVSAMKLLVSEKDFRPERAILNYAWGDEKEVLKVYVSADAEPQALEAAGDAKADQVKVSFSPRSCELRISAEKLDWVLDLNPLYYEIVPDECKFRVSQSKRITLTLKKKEAYTWLKLLKPDA